MDAKAIFAALSFFFSAIAYIWFVRGVLESKTRPTISSWISWGLMDGAILAGMVVAGEIAWQMAAYTFGVCCVLYACRYKKASMDWKNLDTFCVCAVCLAIAGWMMTGNPDVAIIVSLVAITVGSVPMLVNSWRNPHNEQLLPWTLIVTGGAFGVLAIKNWSIAGALTQVVFLLIQIAVFLLIARKFRKKTQAP